jgi:Ca-activated chloride channel family protein
MKTYLCAAFLVAFSLFSSHASNQSDFDMDRSESPFIEYFGPDNIDPDALVLYSTDVDVVIKGVIADVTVRQTYKNTSEYPLEATYVFPASTHAAVYAMTMQVEERILKAEIKEKKEAREIYEKAVEEGRTASLLEQQRPNMFKMSIGNIMSGDSIIIEMKYTELLIPEDKLYQFVYPNVVGPRYISNKEIEAGETISQPAYTPINEGVFKYSMKVDISTALPIHHLSSSTHDLTLDDEDESIKIGIDPEDKNPANRDFILNYSLMGGEIQTGLYLEEHNDENFFLLMVQPPEVVREEVVVPREYIFVVDISGSMSGRPLDISKELMENLLTNLDATEYFNIILFAGATDQFRSESVQASVSNINKGIEFVGRQRGGGGTELINALEKVYDIPKKEGVSRSIAVITDGYVSVEEEAFDLISENLDEANVFAFGIGSSVNRYLIEGMAKVSQGKAFFTVDMNQGKYIAEKFEKYMKSPVLTDIEIEFNGFHAYDVEPQKVPDVFSQRPIVLFGKYYDSPSGKIRVSGSAAGEDIHVDIPIRKFGEHKQGSALKYFWARNKIDVLTYIDRLTYQNEKKDEITELGLQYNLLTDNTSFVAVDYEIRNDGSMEMKKVNQIVNTPELMDVQQTQMTYGKGSARAASYSGGGGYALGDNPLAPSSSYNYGANPLSSEDMERDWDYSSEVEKWSKEEQIDNMKDGDIEPNTYYPYDKNLSYQKSDIIKNLQYSEIAEMLKLKGNVRYLILVDPDGKITESKVESSSNHLLNTSALRAIKKTKFSPAVVDKTKAYAWVSINVKFDKVFEGRKPLPHHINGFRYYTIKSNPDATQSGESKIVQLTFYDKQGNLMERKDVRQRSFNVFGAKGKSDQLLDNCIIGMRQGEIRLAIVNENTPLKSLTKLQLTEEEMKQVGFVKIEIVG